MISGFYKTQPVNLQVEGGKYIEVLDFINRLTLLWQCWSQPDETCFTVRRNFGPFLFTKLFRFIHFLRRTAVLCAPNARQQHRGWDSGPLQKAYLLLLKHFFYCFTSSGQCPVATSILSWTTFDVFMVFLQNVPMNVGMNCSVGDGSRDIQVHFYKLQTCSNVFLWLPLWRPPGNSILLKCFPGRFLNKSVSMCQRLLWILSWSSAQHSCSHLYKMTKPRGSSNNTELSFVDVLPWTSRLLKLLLALPFLASCKPTICRSSEGSSGRGMVHLRLLQNSKLNCFFFKQDRSAVTNTSNLHTLIGPQSGWLLAPSPLGFTYFFHHALECCV